MLRFWSWFAQVQLYHAALPQRSPCVLWKRNLFATLFKHFFCELYLCQILKNEKNDAYFFLWVLWISLNQYIFNKKTHKCFRAKEFPFFNNVNNSEPKKPAVFWLTHAIQAFFVICPCFRSWKTKKVMHTFLLSFVSFLNRHLFNMKK